MIRRFVNVVGENYKTGIYSLHRLDVGKHLFHQSRADARVVPLLAAAQDNTAAAAVAGDEQPMLDGLQELPAPWVKIKPSSLDRRVFFKLPFFGLLCPRSSEDKVLCMNWMGNAVLCDANKQSGEPMLPLQDEVGAHPIAFSVVHHDAQKQGEDLYIIHITPKMGVNPFCFRVLRSCNSEDCTGRRWESLPPPPCVGSPRYGPAHFIDFYSYTMFDGGRTLCLSSADESIGTYCFDTVERQWRHAGHWILPFQGGAENIPDLNLWLGFSPCNRSYNLCGTSDLNNTMAMYQQPPKLEYVWQDLVTPENWVVTNTQLIDLGAGKFCIAKAFLVKSRCTGESDGFTSDDDCYVVEDKFLVLTGVEVGMGGDDRLTLWKHKSVQYRPPYNIKGVL